MEFRRFTELGLRQQKSAAVRQMLDTLPADTDKVVLDRQQAVAWLTALNDLRLALAVRLGLEDDADHDRLRASADEDDEQAGLYHVYDFLTFLQDTLVRALPE